MKHIRIGLTLFGMCFCLLIGANAQTDSTKVKVSDDDTLVRVAYKSVKTGDLLNGISVLNPSDYLDKDYSSYPLDGSVAFVGGENLWKLGNRLILIDGVQREVSDITASEIEQITYLKGANAIVLYGARASNGVILITTKKGKAGAKEMNVRVNSGIGVPKVYPKYLGSADYMKYYNQAVINDGITEPAYTDEEIANYENNTNPYRYNDVDYYSSDYLKKYYNTHSVNADFNGGNERAQFYVFSGFETSNSLVNIGNNKDDHSSRFNVRGKVNLNINDYISTYVDISTVF